MVRGEAVAKDGVRTFLRLMPYWWAHWRLLAVVCLCALVGISVSVAAPVVIGRAVDVCVAVAAGGSADGLAWRLALLALLSVVALVAGWAQDFCMTVVSQRVVTGLRARMMEHMMSLDVTFFDSNSRGDIMSRYSSDIEMIRDGMGQTLVQMLTTLVSVVGMIVSMCALSPPLTLLVCVALPVVVVLSRVVVARSRRLFVMQQEAHGRLNALIEESVGGLRAVRVAGAEREWEARFAEANEAVRRVAMGAQVNSGILMPLLRVLDNATYILVAVVGGLLALGGSVSVGVIQSFLLYTRQFLRPVNMAAAQVGTFQAALAGAERVFEVLDARPSVAGRVGAGRAPSVVGRVDFEGVSFAYRPGEWVLRDVSFSASPGQVVAIVGATGVGKSTLMNLLCRFYDVCGGRILIDGVDIREFDLRALRRSIAVVPQEAVLFSDTVAYNVAYGDTRRPARPDVADSVRRAMAEAFVLGLPDGYDTRLANQGEALSDGQRQLLTIARAVHARAPILILDEATSRVDTRTEALLHDAMANLMRGRTCFVIAHRLGSLRAADHILVLDGGRIVEQGSHDELMRLGGLYRRLFRPS